jgi:hypothetical protein
VGLPARLARFENISENFQSFEARETKSSNDWKKEDEEANHEGND